MSVNLSEADAMIAASHETGNLLTIFQSRRYDPDFIIIKDVIESGKLGRIVLIKINSHSFKRRWDWQVLKGFGGGELRNNGSHLIDQALQLIGPEKPNIFHDLRKTLTLGDAEDHVKIVLKTPESPIIDIEVTNACAYPQNKWLIMGTKGGLTGTESSIKWKYFDLESLPSREVLTNPSLDSNLSDEKISWRKERWSTYKYHSLINKMFKSALAKSKPDMPRNGFIRFYEELYKTIYKGAALAITPESVRRVMWVIEKCMKNN
jgi:predicted dehydrogenase